MIRRLAHAPLAALSVLIAGCAALPGFPVDTPRIQPAAPLTPVVTDADACHRGTLPVDVAALPAIDPRSIRLFNWNVRKGGHDDWTDELKAFAAGADLKTLQEAPLVNEGWRHRSSRDHHAFAPGHETRTTPTGVLTISNVAPFAQCNLSAREPWLRTDKATVVTEYALDGRSETLLVINVHAVNFTFGLGAFEAQMSAASGVIARHRGPVIFTGDFNTWRQGRLALVGALAAGHGLRPVEFARDARKRFLGKPLDHVYVRGLDVDAAVTWDTDTSDHNPMGVWLSAT